MNKKLVFKYEYLEKLTECLKQDHSKEIEKLYNRILEAWKKDRNIFICGNGGSAANSNHIANDLLCVANKRAKKGIKIESLTSNSAVITCIANDKGYQNIFSDQKKIKGKKKDLIIFLSGSGNSKNIIKGISIAKKKGMHTFSILGFNGGKCKKISHEFINYQINDMQISEDIQMIIFNICLKKLMKIKF